MSLRVISLNFGDPTCASSQFRIHSFLPCLQELGIEVETVVANGFTDWKRLEAFDAVIVQKKLFRQSQVRALRGRAKRLLYDIDDAIWEPHGRPHGLFTRLRTRWRIAAIARVADLCLTANEVIARYLRQWTNRAKVFPMCLDGRVWQPRVQVGTDKLRVGWSGAPGNLPYLQALEPALMEVQARHPQIEWTALCGQAPVSERVRWNHVPWTPGCEPQVVPSFAIGLLPLADNPFAAAKSPIKGLQYMACGIPTVATPLQATRELLSREGSALFARSHGEWVQAISLLVSDESQRLRMGVQARAGFEAAYSLQDQAATLASYLKGP